MTLRTCLLITYIATVSAAPYDGINVDRKQILCGEKFVNMLGHYCKHYNTPEDSQRQTRDQSNEDIVTFCCINMCSPRGLVKNYCKEVKQEYQHLFVKLSDQERTNTIVSDKSKEGETRESQEIPLAPTKVVSKKPARCRCRRKNRTFRKTRRAHDHHHSSSSPSKTDKSKTRKRNCRCCKRRQKMKLPAREITKSIPDKPHQPATIGFGRRRNDIIYPDRPAEHQQHLLMGQFSDPFPNSSFG